MRRIKRALIAALMIGVFLSSSHSMAVVSSPAKDPAEPQAKQKVEEDKGLSEFYRSLKEKNQVARATVIARVEGAEITLFDLIGMMNRVAQVYYPGVKELTDEITNDVRQRALDRLIFEELAVKEAIRQGINPKPEAIQKVIDKLKEAYGSEEGYQGYLNEIGLSEEQLRARILRSQRIEGVTGREVYQKVTVESDMVKKLYEEYKEAGKLRKADEFTVKEILVMAGKSEEETKATAEKLLKQLNDVNGDFGKLVLDGTFIVREIDIHKKKYPVIFEKLKEMEVGQLSGIVKDGDTFHIFEVLKNEPARDLTEEEAKGFIEDRLSPSFQEKRRLEWIEGLKKNAKIEIFLEEAEKKLRKETGSPEK